MGEGGLYSSGANNKSDRSSVGKKKSHLATTKSLFSDWQVSSYINPTSMQLIVLVPDDAQPVFDWEYELTYGTASSTLVRTEKRKRKVRTTVHTFQNV